MFSVSLLLSSSDMSESLTTPCVTLSSFTKFSFPFGLAGDFAVTAF